MRIAVLPFSSLDIDTRLSLRAEEQAKKIIANEETFELVPTIGIEEKLGVARADFLDNKELRLLMKELGAVIIVEGSLTKEEGDHINIRLRITPRSSAWRPPTVLSATAAAPEYVGPRTETLVRKFLHSYFDEQSMERFFQSALIPGLGQYREGYTSRAGLFFFGTVGLVLGSLLLPDGNPYVGNGTVEMKQFPGDFPRWYIDDTPVSPEDAEAEMQRRAEAEDSRTSAQRKKTFLFGAGVALYAFNLYDILKITRRYDRVQDRRFTFRLNPLDPQRAITLNYCFDL